MSNDAERDRIRAKLSDDDNKFFDALKELFPGAKLKAIRFSDGETIGNMGEKSE